MLQHMETKHRALKDKALGFFKGKKQHKHKQLLKATTSSNVSTLTGHHHIAKAKNSFTFGEKLILLAVKDIYKYF